MLDCVQGSQERLENQVTHLPTRIRKEPCSTNGDVNALLSAQGFIAPSPKFACDETIFLSGSIQDAMLSLKSLCPDIHQIFSTPQIDSQDQSGIPDELSKWFQAQFHTILKDIFEDSVYPLCPPLPPPSHDWDSRFHASRYLRRRNPSPKGMQPSDIFNKVLRSCQYSTSLYFERWEMVPNTVQRVTRRSPPMVLDVCITGAAGCGGRDKWKRRLIGQ